MRSLRFLDRRTGNRLASIALILGTIVPSLIPALASAAQVTSRSITLSSSTANADPVTYEVKFTIPASVDEGSDAAAFILDFCSNSPIVGQACTAPAGFDTSDVATSTSGATVTAVTAGASSGKSAVKVVKAYTAGDPVDVVLTDIHNPTSAGALYARIITYDTSGHADAYDDTTLGTGAQDNGGVAIAITNNIGVTAAVRETMTFCVASATITADCGDASSNPPTLEIGEGSAGLKALDSAHVSTADIFTQLSTNAASGAVVRLKSDATSCGGLVRVGASSSCDIKPADASTADLTDVQQGKAAFGIKPAAASTSVGSGASGTLQSINSYSNSAYRLNFASDNTTGITSTYGDQILNSNGAPVNNKQMQFTFGASVTNTTPAGTYKANLSMIASGTY